MGGSEISPHSREPRYWNFDVRSDSTLGWVSPAKLAFLPTSVKDIGLKD